MQHPVSDKTFNHWAPAVLRHCTVAEGTHRLCPVRKCRRDGWCTGPLIMIHDDVAPCLAPPERAAVRAGAALFPVCFFLMTEDSRERVSAAYADNVKALRAEPGAIVTEPARATGARRWKKVNIAEEPR